MPASLITAAALALFPGAGPVASTLPLEQAVGQRVVASLPGTVVPDALARAVRRGRVAGVILFSRNIASRAQLRALTQRLQLERRRGPRALRDVPLLVLIDQEGGLVKRLPGAPAHSAAQLGRFDDPARAEAEGFATARNLREVGVNVDLAPVLDVGMPGSQAKVLERSYGPTPGRVARIAGAFARGLAAGGVLACGKHFPGLGRARADQDLTLNRIAAPLAALRRIDEAPFRSLAREQLPLVMTSAAIYPALSRQPAVLARRIVTTELREAVGFQGVALTDDLEVPSLGARSIERRTLAAAQAGNDLLMFAHTLVAAERGSAALVRAVRAGRVSRPAIDAGADRVLTLRETLP